MCSSSPPDCPTEYLSPEPNTNLFLKSGVPSEPSHKAHPAGILSTEPDHIDLYSRSNDSSL